MYRFYINVTFKVVRMFWIKKQKFLVFLPNFTVTKNVSDWTVGPDRRQIYVSCERWNFPAAPECTTLYLVSSECLHLCFPPPPPHLLSYFSDLSLSLNYSKCSYSSLNWYNELIQKLKGSVCVCARASVRACVGKINLPRIPFGWRPCCNGLSCADRK